MARISGVDWEEQKEVSEKYSTFNLGFRQFRFMSTLATQFKKRTNHNNFHKTTVL